MIPNAQDARLGRLFRAAGAVPPPRLARAMADFREILRALPALERRAATPEERACLRDFRAAARDFGRRLASCIASAGGESDPGMIRHEAMAIVYGDGPPAGPPGWVDPVAGGVEDFLSP